MSDLNDGSSSPLGLVVDTNIVLDLWLFQNPDTSGLSDALQQGRVVLLQTLAMQNEIDFVLQRSPMLLKLGQIQSSVQAFKSQLQTFSLLRPMPEPAPWRCKDKSDQMFIDLAWANQTHLLSKDKAVLSLNNKFKQKGIFIRSHFSDLAIV